MKTKRIAFLLSSVMILLLLCGCGGKVTEKEQTMTISSETTAVTTDDNASWSAEMTISISIIVIEALSILLSYVSYRKSGADGIDGWSKTSLVGGLVAGFLLAMLLLPSGVGNQPDTVVAGVVGGIPVTNSPNIFIAFLLGCAVGTGNMCLKFLWKKLDS